VPVDRDYQRNVFINCPFDPEYAPLFEAIVFAVITCGFRPLCARQRRDSSQVRLEKIIELIGAARYSIHDLSRTEVDASTQLPRFNMPLELGVDIGCKRFSGDHRDKTALVFEAQRYQYQKYVSDISGQDIEEHRNDPALAIAAVRGWLRTESGLRSIPGPRRIQQAYQDFRDTLAAISETLQTEPEDLTFIEYCEAIGIWLGESKIRSSGN
jgi:hypothetical protein